MSYCDRWMSVLISCFKGHLLLSLTKTLQAKLSNILDFSRWYTIANAKFEVAASNQLGDAFTRKCIISLLTLTLGQEQTQIIAQYPLQHMTYAPAKFEAAMSNCLGENAYTRNIDLTLKVKVT